MTLGCLHMHAMASLIVAYVLLASHPSSMSYPPIQSCLGCDWIFWFTPFAPHHNHPTMGTNLLCLESITHHGFQFGLKGFECLVPSMVQASPFSLTNYSKIWPTMKFSPTSSPLLWSSALCPFVNKGHQIIVTNLWLNPKFCIQTIPKNTSKIESSLYCEDLSSFAIMCSIKNVMTISWICHVVICLRSLSSSF